MLDNEKIAYIAAKIHDEIDPKWKAAIIEQIDKYDNNPNPEKVSDLVYNVSGLLKQYFIEFAVKFAQALNENS